MKKQIINRSPLTSIIIPVYNAENYIQETIQSVLNQTYRPVEIIVVDDGSTDQSAENIRQFQQSEVKYHFQSNLGAASARNRGIELAQGEFLGFLDADDLWLPKKLELQMRSFQKHPELDMVFGHIKQFRSQELNAVEHWEAVLEKKDIPGISVCTMLIKMKSFQRIGLFEIQWRVGEFLDWYTKAKEAGLKSHMLKEIVTMRRIHTDNIGVRERQAQADYLHILKKTIDRRRNKND